MLAGDAPRSILFCRKGRGREIWDGYRSGPEPHATSGMDEALAIGELDARLPALLADQPSLHYSMGDRRRTNASPPALNAARARQYPQWRHRPRTASGCARGLDRCASSGRQRGRSIRRTVSPCRRKDESARDARIRDRCRDSALPELVPP